MSDDAQEIGGPNALVARRMPDAMAEAGVKIEGDSDIPGIIRLAVDKGVPVEVLERLVALQEHVTERQARAAFFEALARFQDECPVIVKAKTAKIKTRSGSDYAYNYAPLEQIAKEIRPVLRRHGLSYSFTTQQSQHAKVLEVVCILRHVDGHEERALFPVPTESEAAMSPAQRVGAALTYGRRQALVSVLGLTTADEDDDAPDRPTGQVITPDQIEVLNNLIETAGEKLNFHRFLRLMQVEALNQIPAEKFNQAISAINSTMQGVRR